MFKTIKTAKQVKEEKEKQELIQSNHENQKILSETDWYVIRKQETGVDIPEDILEKRQLARDSIVHIEE
jgi:hypothetical protein